MDRATALDALTKAAVDVLSVQADQVTEEASFADDLDADSLDLVELVMQLEDSLDITIDEDDLGDVRTVANAVDLILAASAAHAGACVRVAASVARAARPQADCGKHER